MTPNGILRSVIDFGGVSQNELVANMQKLITDSRFLARFTDEIFALFLPINNSLDP